MKIALMAAAVLALAACAPQSTSGPEADTLPQDVGSLSAADCIARGGSMQSQGRAQMTRCVLTYSDAGKRCTDGDQCQGDCRIEDSPFPDAGASAHGVCQANSSPFGCHASVEDGKATPALCVD